MISGVELKKVEQLYKLFFNMVDTSVCQSGCTETIY